MTEQLQIAMNAINRWLYFGWNYKTVSVKVKCGDSIQEVWVPEFVGLPKWSCPLSHLIEKWHQVADMNNPNSYLTSFYAELDRWNRKILLEWVLTHYDGERKLFE